MAGRLSGRNRINIARAEDTERFNQYLEEWLASLPSAQVLTLDVSQEEMEYKKSVQTILAQIQKWSNS